jgi:hypothetical protein
MKNGKVTTDAALAHMKRILPSDIRDRVLSAIEACRHAGEGEPLGAINTATQTRANSHNSLPLAYLDNC